MLPPCKVINLQTTKYNSSPEQIGVYYDNIYYFYSYGKLIAGTVRGSKFILKDYYKYSDTTSKYTAIFFGFKSAKYLHTAVKNGDIKLITKDELKQVLLLQKK